MEGVKPLGGTSLSAGVLKEFQKHSVRSEEQVVKSSTEAAAPGVATVSAEPLSQTAMAVADQVKLFTSSNLPLKGLYEVQLFDDNKDGRVDAGDAISQYLLLVPQTEVGQKGKPVDELA